MTERELDKSLPIVTTPEAAKEVGQRGFGNTYTAATQISILLPVRVDWYDCDLRDNPSCRFWAVSDKLSFVSVRKSKLNRNLSAIEIAEGALLADIAVIFHLVAVYLPVGGSFFRLLIPVVFAVLVLRRNLYVGIMGLCVAFFTASVVTGLVVSVPILFESGAGLFLGVTMKYRLRHFPLLLLGVTSGTITLYVLILLVTKLLGQSFTDFILSFHRSYEVVVSTLGFIASNVGLGDWWIHTGYPFTTLLAQFVFTYWWALFFTVLWVYLWPVVLITYFITNFFVRLLEYDVRPFPGGRIEKIVRRVTKMLIREGLRRGIIGRHSAKA